MRKTVIFDIGNTLIKFYGVDKSELFYFFTSEILNANGIRPSKHEYQVASKITELFYQTQYSLLCSDEKKFWKDYYTIGFCTFGLDIKKVIYLTNRVLKENIPRPDFSLIDDVKELLDYLTKKGYDIIAMSNWDGTLDNVLSKLEIDSYFKYIYDSELIGWRKPDEAFFDFVKNSTLSSVEDIYYVGDLLLADVIPAKKIGLNAILYDSVDALEPIYKGLRITKLNQLYKLL